MDGSATTRAGAVESAEQLLKHLVEAVQGSSVRTVAHARPVNVPLNQSSPLQRLKVLGDGGLREGQFRHDFAAQARLPLGEGLEDGDAGGVPEGFRPRRQLDGFRGEGLGGCCSHDVLSLIYDER